MADQWDGIFFYGFTPQNGKVVVVRHPAIEQAQPAKRWFFNYKFRPSNPSTRWRASNFLWAFSIVAVRSALWCLVFELTHKSFAEEYSLLYVPLTVLLSSLFRFKKRTEVRKVCEIMSLSTFMLFTLLLTFPALCRLWWIPIRVSELSNGKCIWIKKCRIS